MTQEANTAPIFLLDHDGSNYSFSQIGIGGDSKNILALGILLTKYNPTNFLFTSAAIAMLNAFDITVRDGDWATLAKRGQSIVGGAGAAISGVTQTMSF